MSNFKKYFVNQVIDKVSPPDEQRLGAYIKRAQYVFKCKRCSKPYVHCEFDPPMESCANIIMYGECPTQLYCLDCALLIPDKPGTKIYCMDSGKVGSEMIFKGTRTCDSCTKRCINFPRINT